MIPTINILIYKKGVPYREEIHLPNVEPSDVEKIEELNKIRLIWPDEGSNWKENAIWVWLTFSLSDEERNQYHKVREAGLCNNVDGK